LFLKLYQLIILKKIISLLREFKGLFFIYFSFVQQISILPIKFNIRVLKTRT